ncbi:hypothetical protein [Fluviicola sp.]|uniref:hypothetical protein n=1 Tax=Fluviicola sp. TaxID=1917219 RepID=UPI003D2C09B4
MRFLQITGIFSILLIGLVSCNSKPEEYHLKVPQAHFEVTFPVSKDDVEESMDISVDEEAGEEYKVLSYISDMDFLNENYSYMLTYNSFEGLDSEELVHEMFSANRDILFAELGGEIEFEKDSKRDGIMQKSFCIDQGDDVRTYSKYFFHQGIFYQLHVVTGDPDFPNDSGSKFFKSFKILDK